MPRPHRARRRTPPRPREPVPRPPAPAPRRRVTCGCTSTRGSTSTGTRDSACSSGQSSSRSARSGRRSGRAGRAAPPHASGGPAPTWPGWRAPTRRRTGGTSPRARRGRAARARCRRSTTPPPETRIALSTTTPGRLRRADLEPDQLGEPARAVVHLLVDVPRQREHLQLRAVLRQHGVGDPPADVRVLGVRPAVVLHRRPAPGRLHPELDRPLAPMPVYTAPSRISNTANSANTNGSALGPGGSDRYTRSAGARRAVEHRGGRLRGAHPERVPVVARLDAAVRARRPPRAPGAGRPGRRRRGPNVASRVHTGDSDVKIFVPKYRYDAVGRPLRPGARAEHHEVVARPRSCRTRRSPPRRRPRSTNSTGVVAATDQQRRQPGDDEVHVHRQRGRRAPPPRAAPARARPPRA